MSRIWVKLKFEDISSVWILGRIVINLSGTQVNQADSEAEYRCFRWQEINQEVNVSLCSSITRYCNWNNVRRENSVQDPLLLKLLFVGIKTMPPSVTAKQSVHCNIHCVPFKVSIMCSYHFSIRWSCNELRHVLWRLFKSLNQLSIPKNVNSMVYYCELFPCCVMNETRWWSDHWENPWERSSGVCSSKNHLSRVCFKL